jgi:hypothetical protein
MEQYGGKRSHKAAKTFVFAVSMLIPATTFFAQEQSGGFDPVPGMQRVGGQITAISGDRLTIKAQDGLVYQVVTTTNTRMMKQGGATFKPSELKVGDGVMSAGNFDAPTKTMHAAMLLEIDAEQVKKLSAARQQAAASMGKTIIMGRVTAIDMESIKMTVERPDHVSQTITFDQNTSFRRIASSRMGASEAGSMGFDLAALSGEQEKPKQAAAGESITLADIRVGDVVDGPGLLKGGVFVPKQLSVRTPHATAEHK